MKEMAIVNAVECCCVLENRARSDPSHCFLDNVQFLVHLRWATCVTTLLKLAKEMFELLILGGIEVFWNKNKINKSVLEA